MSELQPRGWLITYNISGKQHTIFSGHNCVGDYQNFSRGAKAEAVYTCGPELITELGALRKDAEISRPIVDAAKIYYERYAQDEAMDGESGESWTGCSEVQSQDAI